MAIVGSNALVLLSKPHGDGVGDEAMARAGVALARAERVVVFTGAGISADSGVPTFRDDLTGLWARFDPHQLATPEAFHADPDLVWGWYEWRRARVQQAQPNPAHTAVAAIKAMTPACTVITQNVDDLHERAGVADPIHLHGSLFTPRCIGAPPHPAAHADDVDHLPEGCRIPPPRCRTCGALVRPGVVWFGEALPDTVLDTALRAAASCDLLMTVGASALVYPAADIPRVAARSGATVIQINPQSTPPDRLATINLRGTAAHLLPALTAAAQSPGLWT